MTPVTLRAAKGEDIAAIVAMLADDDLGSGRDAVTNPLPRSYSDAFEEIANDPNTCLLVAEQDGEIVGTLQITFMRGLSRKGARRANIESVRVASKRRGAGLGRQMLRKAIDLARAKGCAMVQLTAHKARSDAHRFYESLGFVASHQGMKLDLDPPKS